MSKVPVHLYFIHLALMLGPAFFALSLYFLVLPQATEMAMPKEQASIYQVVAAALAVIGVGISQIVPRFFFRGEKSVPLAKYITMKIVQWALVEAAALFIAVVYFLTHDKNMLISLGVLIAILAFMRPTVDELLHHNVKA